MLKYSSVVDCLHRNTNKKSGQVLQDLQIVGSHKPSLTQLIAS